MQYKRAGEREEDGDGAGTWDYIFYNDDGHTRRIGYCAGEPLSNRSDVPEKYLEKYHDDGHESKEAAEACYAEFLFDHHLEYRDPKEYEIDDIDDVSMGDRIDVCDHDSCGKKLTGNTVVLEARYQPGVSLCSEHQNDEHCKEFCQRIASGLSMLS